MTDNIGSEQMPENMKELINNLLWMILPGYVTLQEADEIALDLWRRAAGLWANDSRAHKSEE